MKRCSFWILVVLMAFGGSSSAAAAGSKLAKYMGDLRWGMSESEVIRYLENRLSDKYKPLIKKAGGRRETALREELRRLKREIRSSHVEFDGSRTRWDRSVVAGEFNQDNEESMLVFEGNGYESFYLFHEGRLWKWVKAVDTQKFGGRDLKKVGKKLKKRFGKGHMKTSERNPTAGKQRFLEWRDRNSRLRAVDVTREHGQFSLVFVQTSTDRELASARNKQKRRGGGSSMARAPERSRSPAMGAGSKKKRKSIFGGGGGDESERAYRARVKREKKAALAKQRRMHDRKSERKKGKALDDVSGLEDTADPMAGL